MQLLLSHKKYLLSWQTRANEISDGLEEEYESSKDDVSSVSSYNPSKGTNDMAFRSSLSLQSMVTRVSNSEAQRSNFPAYIPLSQLSVAEIVDDPSGGKDPCSMNMQSKCLMCQFPIPHFNVHVLSVTFCILRLLSFLSYHQLARM